MKLDFLETNDEKMAATVSCSSLSSFIHLTISLQKFQQKAQKQTKQKKSKSSDFLMQKIRKFQLKSLKNPAFNINNTDISAHQTYKVGLIRYDKLTCSLAAHPQKLRLQAQAEPRGNECSRNYFDPLMDEEINPRQCGIEVSKEGEAELNELFLHDKLMWLINKGRGRAGVTWTMIMPSAQMKVEEIKGEDTLDSMCFVNSIKTSGLCDEVEDEDILPYIEQFEKEVHNEVILLGNLPCKQDLKYEGIFQDGKFSRKFSEVLQSKPENQVLETASNGWKMRAAAKLRNLAGVSHNSNGTAVPCWKVNRTKKSQFTDIHLKCLRGIKDKVPQGSYSLKVSICKQLNGKFLACSKVDGQQLTGKSLPVRHNGNFYDVEISFGQSIYTDVPVRKNGKPGEILLFELFLLQGTSGRVVGWGVFPLCNNNLEIVDGKFKCPLLRGHYDSRIDRFQKIEKLISSDLDHWLCNLYFQIIKLPWYSNEEYKYEVGLQPSSKILQYSSTAEKDGISKEIIGQPLTPRRDSDTHKGSIPSAEKEVRKRFNTMKKNDPNDVVVQSGSKIRLDADDGVLRSYQEELEKHRFSVCCHPAVDANMSSRLAKHFYFGAYDAFFELGRGQWYSWDFWTSVLLISFLWFIRLYLHYFSQWILLHVFAVPVTK
ncbi:orofacial cleft 1 candidate gene 1 protein [Pseudonaja textilis]|uniref:orofacial cleft 1 candidate gene 1 protein n=1 Tax=Pseudonaja textilis TaxID=8673 RepID=UPI000EAA76EF|nr:orofacial cleft 1 candidate gene 1 protein [Pseudonaja textilis]